MVLSLQSNGVLLTKDEFISCHCLVINNLREIESMWDTSTIIDVEEQCIPALKEKMAYIYSREDLALGDIITDIDMREYFIVKSVISNMILAISTSTHICKIWDGPHIKMCSVNRNVK